MKIILQNTLGDIPKIHEEIFGEEFPHDSMKEKIRRNNLLIFGYYDDERLIGYSIVEDQKFASDLYAWYGGVLPEYQGKGITAKFFDILVEKAKELGRESISLATTNKRPNMIRLAIKYGFEIVDLKKRYEGEGNKIYFRLWIRKPSEVTIPINKDGIKKKCVDLEPMLVNAYRNNCVKIYFTNILDDEDVKTVEWAMKYCEKFIRKPKIEYSFENVNL